jgi:hypothetical protein
VNTWDVSITLDVATPDEKVLDAIREALPSGSAVGRSAWSDALVVSVELHTFDVERAAELGILLARHAAIAALGAEVRPIGVEVLTPEQSELRSARADQPLDLVSVTETADMLGVTPGRIRQRAAAGDLGAIKVGEAGWAFPRALVEREAATH